MVLWSDIEKNLIEFQPGGRERTRFTLDGRPLRFQIPRGLCTWGVSQYKSFNVEVKNPEFIAWWSELERRLCPQEPFKSNLQSGSLRLKIDDATYIFDENSVQISPEVREGLFRGQELSCMIDIESNYFFNGNWGITVRAYQVKSWGGGEQPETPQISEPILAKGICAFLETESS